MNSFQFYDLLNNRFIVTARKTLFWENEKIMILSDLHLGKTGHFRKSGIGIPQTVMLEDMQRLFAEIQHFNPTTIIIIGDLFHSTGNKEHEFFLKWRHDFPQLEIILIKGNHDILHENWYQAAGIKIVPRYLCKEPFIFLHDLEDLPEACELFAFAGHVHPAIQMRGVGKQSLRLPCFYFGKQYAILPAFGNFTGTYTIEPQQGDAVFAIAEKSIIKL